MDFETLIWIIIFLIWAASAIIKNRLKKRAEAKTPAAAKKRPGWKTKLDAFLARIQEEMEAAKARGKPPGAETGWEKLMPRKYEDEEPEIPGYEREAEEISTAELEEEIIFEDREPLVVAPPPEEKPIFRPEERAPTVRRAPPVLAEERRSARPSYSAAALRKAVIWSEILAPPTALRE